METAKRPKVSLGGHTETTGPVLYVGAHQYELNERTAASWLNTLSNFMWHRKFSTTQYDPENDSLQGDE